MDRWSQRVTHSLAAAAPRPHAVVNQARVLFNCCPSSPADWDAGGTAGVRPHDAPRLAGAAAVAARPARWCKAVNFQGCMISDHITLNHCTSSVSGSCALQLLLLDVVLEGFVTWIIQAT